jgi:hypothetical protein
MRPGAREGNRTLVISLEGYQSSHDVSAEVDKFSVRSCLDAIPQNDPIQLRHGPLLTGGPLIFPAT